MYYDTNTVHLVYLLPRRRTHRVEPLYHLAPEPVGFGGARAVLARQLDDPSTTLDRVDEDVSRGEERIRGPTPNELDAASALLLVVLGVDIEECCLADSSTRGIRGNGARIEYVKTCAVVGLVDVVVNDVLVVVDT